MFALLFQVYCWMFVSGPYHCSQCPLHTRFVDSMPLEDDWCKGGNHEHILEHGDRTSHKYNLQQKQWTIDTYFICEKRTNYLKL